MARWWDGGDGMVLSYSCYTAALMREKPNCPLLMPGCAIVRKTMDAE